MNPQDVRALCACAMALMVACGGGGSPGDARALADAGVDRVAPADGGAADRSTVDAAAAYAHEDITAQTLNGWLSNAKDLVLIDVREASEYVGGHLAGATNLAWTSGQLQKSLAQLSRIKPLVIYCGSGARSDKAATYLAGQGFKPVYDMLGGINAWNGAGYPTTK